MLTHHAQRRAAMIGTSDTDTIGGIKDSIVTRALVKSLQADAPEVFDPSIPTNVHIDSNREIKFY